MSKVKQELQPLLLELCHIAKLRNAINTRRHRARYRKNYYAKAIRVVEAHFHSNYELRYLNAQLNRDFELVNAEDIESFISRLQERIRAIKWKMESIRNEYINHKKPLKWQQMGLYKLRSLTLKGEAEYAAAKHETMEFSIKYRSRVKKLLSELNCNLKYSNGSISAIFSCKDSHLFAGNKEIMQYATQYELNSAVERMLKEQV